MNSYENRDMNSQEFDRDAWLKQKQEDRDAAFGIVADTVQGIKKDGKQLQQCDL